MCLVVDRDETIALIASEENVHEGYKVLRRVEGRLDVFRPTYSIRDDFLWKLGTNIAEVKSASALVRYQKAYYSNSIVEVVYAGLHLFRTPESALGHYKYLVRDHREWMYPGHSPEDFTGHHPYILVGPLFYHRRHVIGANKFEVAVTHTTLSAEAIENGKNISGVNKFEVAVTKEGKDNE